jgi:hypothetical protein
MISQEIVDLMNANSVFAVGTVNGKNEPFYTRSYYMHGNVGENKLFVHIPEIMAARPLQDLKENQHIAVNVADITNFFARQLKGMFLGSRPSTPEEISEIKNLQNKFEGLLGNFFGPEFASNWSRIIIEPSICITLEVQEVFEQTPKSGTGGKII